MIYSGSDILLTCTDSNECRSCFAVNGHVLEFNAGL